jgi:hypothetical protein
LATVGKYTNATYHYNDVGVWTGLEAYLGVICACMPSIVGPVLYFFRNVVGSKFTEMTSSYTNNSEPRSTSRFRVTFDKDDDARLHSRATERDEEVELDKHAPKRDEAEKTHGTTIYGLPGEQTSSDDGELVYYDTLRETEVKGQYSV